MAGYRRERTVNVEDEDIWLMPFQLDPSLESAAFRIEFSDSLYNGLTDCAVNILDAEGVPLVADAMSRRDATVTLKNPKPEAAAVPCTLQVWAGFTNDDAKEAWSFDLRESYVRKNPERLSVESGQGTTFLMAPGAPVELKLRLDDAPRTAPDGTFNYGEVVFRDKVRSRTRFVLPVRIE
jgi:hypothetical protein